MTILTDIRHTAPSDALSRGVLAAVSGGADSTALLRILADTGVPMLAVHCNFSLRGEESDRDEAFVRRLCLDLGVELHVERFDTLARCRATGESVEMACRALRYDLFRRLIAERGLARIAVAHNADDNAETMLLNLFRGTGLAGLCAMREDNGEIWRPLIGVTRSEILAYLASIGQDYVTDSSNLSTDYRRNFIRLEVLPLIRSRWPAITDTLWRTRRNLEDALNVYRQAISRELAEPDCLSLEGAGRTGSVRSAVFEFLNGTGATADTIERIARHAESRLSGEPHRHREWMAGERRVVMERDAIRILPPDGSHAEPVPEWTQLEPTAENIALAFGNSDPYTAYLPSGPDSYTVRPPRPGERLRLFGGGSVKISKAMKDAGLSASEKERLRILTRTDTDAPIWAIGLRRGATDLIDRNTSEPFWRVRMLIQPSESP